MGRGEILWLLGGNKSIAGRAEKDVAARWGSRFFPPKLCEARREFEGKLPWLLELRDMRGVLHMRTTVTDGEEAIEAPLLRRGVS